MLKNTLITFRPRQWTKNLLVFAAPVFSLSIVRYDAVVRSLLLFCAFCLASGAVYIMNDLFDRERDRLHPQKKNRPIASGRLGTVQASTAALIAAVLGLGLYAYLGPPVLLIAVSYIIINVLYNIRFKRIVIIDLFTVTSGYLLRVIAGAVAINVEISHWLLLCTFMLAMFLVLCKRRSELASVGNADAARPVLSKYSVSFLNRFMVLTAGLTALSYALYTMAPQTIQKFGTRNLMYTFPFVLFGIIRYLYIAADGNKAESPELVVLKDAWMIGAICAWALTAAAILYR